jgi:hypothetical protein
MPVTTSSVAAINDLATVLAGQLRTSGNAARAAVGDRAVAFGWTSGARISSANIFASTLAEGLTWRATRITLTATPPAKVARGGVKPVAAKMTTETRTLAKYAGQVSVEIEDLIDVDSLVPALASVILDGCMAAFDQDIAAALEGAGGPSASGATWSEAILAGIAAVPSASVLVVNAADYASVVSPGVGFTLDPTNSVPVLFGLLVVIAPITPGTAYVCDRNAVMVCDSKLSPLAVVDPFSQADQNVTRLVVDLLADAYVTAPAGICAVSVAAGQ